MSAPDVGEAAPDFTLPGTAGDFTLSAHRGERVVLLFYPGDETVVCTRQFCSYRAAGDDLGEALGAVVVGISPQDLESHRGFTEHHGLNVPLLADTDKAVAKAYGVLGPLGAFVRRATFVVGPDGRVTYKKVHAVGLRYESADEIRAALA